MLLVGGILSDQVVITRPIESLTAYATPSSFVPAAKEISVSSAWEGPSAINAKVAHCIRVMGEVVSTIDQVVPCCLSDG